VGPVGPVGPVDPVHPVGPVGPVGPFGPTNDTVIGSNVVAIHVCECAVMFLRVYVKNPEPDMLEETFITSKYVVLLFAIVTNVPVVIDFKFSFDTKSKLPTSPGCTLPDVTI
jgi:hypothetical protein